MERVRKMVVAIVLFVIIICLFSRVKAAGTSGTVIVINPGHGGSWTGCANNEYGLVEKNLTLKIGKYLKEILEDYYNVKVILTHDGVTFPKNDAGDLAARAMVARNNKADLYVSLHINDTTDKSVNGANVFVTSRTELPKYKQGMTTLGNKILKKLNELGIKNNGVVYKLCQDHEPTYQYYDGSQADYYADIRHAMRGDPRGDYGADFRDGSGIPTVLIEHCYMNNSHDVQFLDSDADLKRLAQADATAIIDYLQLKKGVISIQGNPDFMKIGDTKQLSTKADPTGIATNVKWESSNSNIIEVYSNGKITAKAAGTAKIKVLCQDKSVFSEVQIKVINSQEKYTIGDVNNDGKVNTLDAVKVLQYVSKKISLTDTQILAADTNKDGKINTLDAVRILQFVAKKITAF